MRQGLLSAAALLLLSGASPLVAQSMLRGIILDDSSGQPIAGAQVELLDVRNRRVGTTLSDPLGVFLIPSARAGVYSFRANRLGYRGTTTPRFRLVQHDTMDVEIRLDTEAVLLAPLEVTARSRLRVSPVLEGFYYRKERGFGSFITREEIESRSPFYLTDVLTMIPGVRLGPSTGRGGRHVYMVRSIQRGECPVQIYLDGFLVNRPLSARTLSDSTSTSNQYAHNLEFTIDDVVSPSAVEGIEIYRGLSDVPAEFGGHDARCGVIVIWTRRGGRRH
ncbi:MAG: TonB-dependent receptor [Gemmatimonadetes bacterium]|nr:TonB-dependent receptor [Gemmatimonadota bacterium]MBA4158725.1 TonB-dependent receptor [Gemmatimonadota bacterium]